MNGINKKNGQGRVLFLCTGNYYRSRFAELYFNHYNANNGNGWLAESRGILPPNPGNIGPISQKAQQRLKSIGVTVDLQRWPLHVSHDEMEEADIIIALQETEHRPMIKEFFPAWEERIEFWEVPDSAFLDPEQAMTNIQEKVREIVKLLHSH